MILDDPTWLLSVSFEIPDYDGGAAYLQMMTFHVQNTYNDVYMNGEWEASLKTVASGASLLSANLTRDQMVPLEYCWWNETIVIKNLKKGKNVLEIMSRDANGLQKGNIDYFRMRNPLLIYGTSM